MTTQPSDWAPCPFCGGQPELYVIERHTHTGPAAFMPDYEGGQFIECGCGVAIAVAPDKDAGEVWNRRAPVARELDASGGGSEDSLLSIVRESIRNAERHPRKTYGLRLETLQRFEQELFTPRAAEAYAKANPLGGPATMFETIARRLRAGENYDEVMADYGLTRAAEAGDDAKWRAFREMPEHEAADIAWLNPGEERDAAMGAVGATSPGTGQTEA